MTPQRSSETTTYTMLEQPDFSVVVGGPLLSTVPASTSVRGCPGASAPPDPDYHGFRLVAARASCRCSMAARLAEP